MLEEVLADNAEWVHENTADIKIKLIRGHTAAINNCQFIHEDTKLFTTSDDLTARIWDKATGKELIKYSDLHERNIMCSKVSQDNTKFITCSYDKTVKCWDLETGKLLWKNFHDSFVTSCDISFDGKYCISVSDLDYLVKITDSKTGNVLQQISDIHTNTITSCKFCPNSDRFATTSMDRTTKLYDLSSKKVTLTLSGHTNVISNSSFTPDERTLATSSWDKTIKVWDIATGMYRKNGPVVLARGHEGSVSACCINSNASLLVSGGYDLRIILWDLNHATIKLPLRGHSDWITDVTMTKDNKWIMSVGRDREIRLWSIENCDKIKVVAEQNRILGNKTVKCIQCSRPFSITQLQRGPTTGYTNTVVCVFCRLEEQAHKLNNRSPLGQTLEIDNRPANENHES